jgi:hypothetical protein
VQGNVSFLLLKSHTAQKYFKDFRKKCSYEYYWMWSVLRFKSLRQRNFSSISNNQQLHFLTVLLLHSTAPTCFDARASLSGSFSVPAELL